MQRKRRNVHDFVMDSSFSVFFQLALLMQTISGLSIQNGQQGASINTQFLFPVMKHYMPHGKHLKTKRLYRKLGKDFESEWMSVELPRFSNYVPDTIKQTTSIQSGLDKSRLGVVVESYATDLNLNNQSKEIIKNFLQTMSTCQTNFEWEDLGSLFWPRYVKSGSCSSGWSCSWPTGMLCQESEIKTLRPLHWRCKRRNRQKHEKYTKSRIGNKTIGPRNKRTVKPGGMAKEINKTLKCRWKKISYKVTASCACSC